ncbi:MAG: NAD(P)-dependent oxidoreductase [Microbacteriaceae bacterium]|nr:NAD(P)-dependent oxidoreductase [Microbacteriaceae bacterium]
MPSLGFIGLGNMGMPMALNFLAVHPQRMTVTGRSKERAERAIAAGARWVATPREVATASQIVVLMVPDLPQVMELLFSTGGIAEAEGDVAVVVCSSVAPAGIRELDLRLRRQTDDRMRIVDAPVSGGVEGAAAATLSIMVGGDATTVSAVLPVLRLFGTPVHLGPLGSGDVAKACNQLIVAATIAAISEASVIAERSGIDLDALLSLLQQGYAGSRVLETKRQRLVDRDYTASGVARYMVKDLGFAAATAAETASFTPVLDGLRVSFDALVAQGLGDFDLAVMHRYVESQSRSE